MEERSHGCCTRMHQLYCAVQRDPKEVSGRTGAVPAGSSGVIEGSGPIWFDEHLFRDGAMSDLALMLILSEWERYGVQPVVKRRGKKVWKDC